MSMAITAIHVTMIIERHAFLVEFSVCIIMLNCCCEKSLLQFTTVCGCKSVSSIYMYLLYSQRDLSNS